MRQALDREKEKALIERLKDGERAAFDDLVESYRSMGFSIAYNMAGNLEDAKDILQDAFIKVYLNIRKYREAGSFSTWFYRIVVNCSLDYLRKRRVRSNINFRPLTDEEGREIEVADLDSEGHRQVLQEEFRHCINNCIAALPEKQKTCFILKHQSGFSCEEIAGTLGCSMSTVKVHLFRAVKNLQGKLGPYIAK